MTESDLESAPDPQSLFPLHSARTYQGTLSKYLDIGIDFHDSSAELRRRLVAAAASTMTGYAGVDYLLKNHFKNFEPEDPFPDRRDTEFEHKSIWLFQDIVESIQGRPASEIESSCIGHFISDATLIRLRFTLKRCFAEANIGALYECAAILRLAVEIFSWACEVRDWDDSQKIQKRTSSKSISFVRKAIPEWGTLYGVLSKYSHWEYSAHVNILNTKAAPENGDVMLASVNFKMAALILIAVFVRLALAMAPKLTHFAPNTDENLAETISDIEDIIRIACRLSANQFPDIVLLAAQTFQIEPV